MLEDRLFVVAVCGGMRCRAVQDLVHRVDPFPFAGAATNNEYFRDQMEVRIAGIVLSLALVVFT